MQIADLFVLSYLIEIIYILGIDIISWVYLYTKNRNMPEFELKTVSSETWYCR